MNDKIFDNKTIFNKEYFKIGEFVKVKEYNNKKELRKSINGLVLYIEDDCIKIAMVEILSSSKNTVISKIYWLKDIQEGKVDIIKYNENEGE